MLNVTQELWRQLDQKTKPPRSLGRLESLAVQIGQIQGQIQPEIEHPTMLIFAGDHGIVEEGVSAYPQAVTAQMVENFLAGGAAISVLSRSLGWSLKVVDAGVKSYFKPHPLLLQRKLGWGTDNFRHRSAMTAEQLHQGLQTGALLVDELHQQGCDFLGLGEMGIGNSSSAALLLALLTPHPLERLVGPGTGLDDVGIRHKLEVLQAAYRLHAPACSQRPWAALASVGGFEMVMLVGAARQAARLRIPVVVDGLIVTAAILAWVQAEPQQIESLIFAHRSREPGHRLALDTLAVEPYLDLDMALGEGSGAALLLPLARAALAILQDMATFESARVSSRTPTPG